MAQSLKNIKGFAYDIDGVMTDGSVLAMPDGDILRIFNAKDSFGVRMASIHGYKLAVITGGRSESLIHRSLMCGVPKEDVYLNSRNKVRDLLAWCDKYGLKPEEVMYFGDDIPDVAVLKMVGIGVAPCDACAEAKEAADIVSPYGGGRGCVRHAIEEVLKAQGQWTFDVDKYEKRF